MLQAASIDPGEVEKFSRMADEWWDMHGKFKPLHRINPVRLEYLRDMMMAETGKSLQELSILDVGCGGGLLAEPLARLGAQVTGIDASEKNIRIAALHAEQSGINVDYRCQSIESLAESGAQFDVVLTMEVIEHVADVASFVAACCAVAKLGGLVIVGAEYVLRWLPRGTHHWSKFLTPSEIASELRHHGLNWQRSKDLATTHLRIIGCYRAILMSII